MKNENDDCKEEHGAPLHLRMNRGIYNIPEKQQQILIKLSPEN